jgi:hypothetical protein
MKPNTVGQRVGVDAALPQLDATGLMAKSIILTMQGEKRVEELRAGDRIITRDSGMAILKGLRARRVATRAVRIKAGSLGHTRPERDVTVPAGQPVLIRDWRAEAIFGAKQAMVPAARLVDGEFVTLHEDATMTVYQLEFDAPHVLYVDGLEVASHGAKAAISKAA